jgi:hypothetical protein
MFWYSNVEPGDACWNYAEYDRVPWEGCAPDGTSASKRVYGRAKYYPTTARGNRMLRSRFWLEFDVSDLVGDWYHGEANEGFLVDYLG